VKGYFTASVASAACLRSSYSRRAFSRNCCSLSIMSAIRIGVGSTTRHPPFSRTSSTFLGSYFRNGLEKPGRMLSWDRPQGIDTVACSLVCETRVVFVYLQCSKANRPQKYSSMGKGFCGCCGFTLRSSSASFDLDESSWRASEQRFSRTASA